MAPITSSTARGVPNVAELWLARPAKCLGKTCAGRCSEREELLGDTRLWGNGIEAVERAGQNVPAPIHFSRS
jgi:hypothetical protein